MGTGGVPQTEREDEIRARDLMAAELGVELVHADTNGGVDYRFRLPDCSPEGRSAGAEVTTVTDPDAKRNNDACMKLRDCADPAPSVANCWAVVVHEGHATFNALSDRLEPVLATLEATGLDRFEDWKLLGRLPETPAPVRTAAGVLRGEVVVQARVFATRDEHLVHRIYVSPICRWVARGSTDAWPVAGTRKCHRHKTDNHAHDIVKGDPCLVVDVPIMGKQSFCVPAGKAILDLAERDIARLHGDLGV